MKKYMLIIAMEGEVFTTFSNDFAQVSQSKMDAECGMGAYCELYERALDDDLEQMAYRILEI